MRINVFQHLISFVVSAFMYLEPKKSDSTVKLMTMVKIFNSSKVQESYNLNHCPTKFKKILFERKKNFKHRWTFARCLEPSLWWSLFVYTYMRRQRRRHRFHTLNGLNKEISDSQTPFLVFSSISPKSIFPELKIIHSFLFWLEINKLK